MKRYAFHPVCLLFPQMTDQELQDLAQDIKAKGLLHAILLHKGKILDGRNRYLACGMAGVEPRFKEWRGEGSPLQWAISENMVRRHLTSSQRAVLALELLPLLEEEAHQRKRLSPGRGKNTRKKLRMFSSENGNGEARQIAARMTGSNAVYVQAAKAIQQQAPELLHAIRSGTLRVPDAARLAPRPRRQLQSCRTGLGQNGLISRSAPFSALFSPEPFSPPGALTRNISFVKLPRSGRLR